MASSDELNTVEPSSRLHPADIDAATVSTELLRYLCLVMIFMTAVLSETMYPRNPHSLRVMSVSSSLLAQEGMPFTLKAEKIKQY